MIFETLDIKFDIEKLKDHLNTIVSLYPPVWHIDNQYGGWGVTSFSGSYREAWDRSGHFTLQNGIFVFDEQKAIKAACPPLEKYNVPTEICTGYLLEIMNIVAGLGLFPRRARIAFVRGGWESHLHQDYKESIYAVRLHIPILTNPESLFICDEGMAHLPADGSAHLLKINRPHKVVNRGKTERHHIMMDVWDTRNISKYHRYPGGQDIKWGEYPF